MITYISVPIDYRQEAVRLHSSSGSWQNKHPASLVLHYYPSDDDYTSWMALTSSPDNQWFVLDLSAPMSFDAMQIANSKCKPDDDGYTKDFKYMFFRKLSEVVN